MMLTNRDMDCFERPGEPPPAQIPMEIGLLAALDSALAGSNVTAKLQAAARLLQHGLAAEAIEGFQCIAERHPDRRAACLEHIGDTLLSMGQFENAAESYDEALAAGASGADQGRLQAKVVQALQREATQPMGVELPEGVPD